MNNKLIFITKIGYTKGYIGCTGEYFQVIATDGGKVDSFIMRGMYGVESRIKVIFEKAGYEYIHIPYVFGQLKRDDLRYSKNHILDEAGAVHRSNLIVNI